MHSEPRADALLALQLGHSISSHYNTWECQSSNITKPSKVKVSHLLCYWKERNDHTSMKELAMDFNEKLKSEPSFNSMRQQIYRRFV